MLRVRGDGCLLSQSRVSSVPCRDAEVNTTALRAAMRLMHQSDATSLPPALLSMHPCCSDDHLVVPSRDVRPGVVPRASFLPIVTPSSRPLSTLSVGGGRE
jgi:hypothetical protein